MPERWDWLIYCFSSILKSETRVFNPFSCVQHWNGWKKHAIGSVDVIKGASLTIREFLLKTKRYISSSKFYFNSFKFQEVYFHKIEVCPFANLKQFIKTFAQIVSVYLSEHFFEFLKKDLNCYCIDSWFLSSWISLTQLDHGHTYLLVQCIHKHDGPSLTTIRI